MKYEALGNIMAGKDFTCSKGQQVELNPEVAAPFVQKGLLRPLAAVVAPADLAMTERPLSDHEILTGDEPEEGEADDHSEPSGAKTRSKRKGRNR